MGGGGAHGGTTYKGYTIPHNKRWHTVAGKGLCAVMWYACAPPCSPFPSHHFDPSISSESGSFPPIQGCLPGHLPAFYKLNAMARGIRPRLWASARVDQEMLGIVLF
jgi:hypothetical protein